MLREMFHNWGHHLSLFWVFISSSCMLLKLTHLSSSCDPITVSGPSTMDLVLKFRLRLLNLFHRVHRTYCVPYSRPSILGKSQSTLPCPVKSLSEQDSSAWVVEFPAWLTLEHGLSKISNGHLLHVKIYLKLRDKADPSSMIQLVWCHCFSL